MTDTSGVDKRLAALEAHREAGQFRPLDPAGGPSVVLQARVPMAVAAELDAASSAEGLTRSEALRVALAEWLAVRRDR